MDQELKSIITKIRTIANEKGIEAISLEMLYKNPDIPDDVLEKYFLDNETLAEKILEDERSHFEEIFVEHNFDGYNDAIDILFTVIIEMARKFYHLSPSVTYKYQQRYPEVYQKHIEERINFIYGKIQINLQKGISLGFYRDDVSIELVARLYIRRLIDLHDTDNFPPENFSMETMFIQMFERFVRSVATEKGIAYFEKKKKSTKLDH
jgi:hypothetical protein